MTSIVLPQPSHSSMNSLQHPNSLAAQFSHGTANGASNHLYARRKTKAEVCEHYLQRLAQRLDVDASAPAFQDSIRRHFNCLPTRYALDVNLDSLDVLSHKRLLDEARADPTAVSFAIRPVEIIVPKHPSGNLDSPASPQVRHVLQPGFMACPRFTARQTVALVLCAHWLRRAPRHCQGGHAVRSPSQPSDPRPTFK